MGGFWQVLGGLSGAVSIMAGAYGAHGLNRPGSEAQQGKGEAPSSSSNVVPLSADQREKVWMRAVSYQQLHSVALLLVPLLTPAGSATRLVAGASFAGGIVCFSGGLYGHALTGDKRVSSVAPFGGMAFIAGWLVLALAGARRLPPPLPRP